MFNDLREPTSKQFKDNGGMGFIRFAFIEWDKPGLRYHCDWQPLDQI